jgi:hypothetical protein
VPRCEKFGDDGGTDVPGRAGDKYMHGRSLLIDVIKSMTGPGSLSKSYFIWHDAIQASQQLNGAMRGYENCLHATIGA